MTKEEQRGQKPKTWVFVLVNAALWCLYFIYLSVINSGQVGIVLIPIALATVLVITTTAQFLVHLVLRKRKMHGAFRTALFFVPSVVLVLVALAIPKPPTLPNQVQPMPSPSGKYVLTVPTERNPNYHDHEVWKVTISDTSGEVLYKDNSSECVGWLNAYWAWDNSDRAWLYNSDDGRVYFWESDGTNWTKMYWGYGKTNREIDRVIEQPDILYPYDD